MQRLQADKMQRTESEMRDEKQREGERFIVAQKGGTREDYSAS